MVPIQPNELVIVQDGKPETSDLNLAKLAAFMGVPVRRLSVTEGPPEANAALADVFLQGGCVAVNARSLQRLRIRFQSLLRTERAAQGSRACLFVYGFEPGEDDSKLVRDLSGGAFSAVREPDASANQYSVCADAKAFCQEFSALTFGRTDPKNDFVFQRAKSGPRVSDYIRIGEHPFLAAIQEPGCLVVLAGTRDLLDIDSSAESGRLLDRFSELVPPMLFLRYVFEDCCWRGLKKLASFIVDDPLLRRRHGFLRYDALLGAMERSNFSTNISFIPWNCRRSHRDVINLFHRFPQRLSLSIHGCDHTGGEFASLDESLLRRKARVAMRRMQVHQQLTGIPFDRVMVFPQGAFSSIALTALKTTGYLAAVNSTPFALDGTRWDLRWRELLDLAVTRYGGFPLFIRHYPNQVADFALDLFLGKPALIVQHHGDFKHGYEEIEDFVQKINRLAHGITWCGLETVSRCAGARRRDTDGSFAVRFCCREGLVENRDPVARRFRFQSEFGDHGLPAEAEVQPGETAQVQVPVPTSPESDGPDPAEALMYRVKVFSRRALCEIRDNYVSRLPLPF